MFNGIVFTFYKIFFLKYFIINNFFILKFNKEFFELNIGDSLSINGICLTLINKSLFFFEFDFSWGTLLNISNFNNSFLNFEKCFYIFNNLNGHFLYGHINNLFLLKNKFIYYNIIKLFLLFLKDFLKFLIYKISIATSGLSLTVNEIFFFNNSILISLNILNFTYFFTNFKLLRIFDLLNIEIDLSLFYILKFLFYF